MALLSLFNCVCWKVRFCMTAILIPTNFEVGTIVRGVLKRLLGTEKLSRKPSTAVWRTWHPYFFSTPSGHGLWAPFLSLPPYLLESLFNWPHILSFCQKRVCLLALMIILGLCCVFGLPGSTWWVWLHLFLLHYMILFFNSRRIDKLRIKYI